MKQYTNDDNTVSKPLAIAALIARGADRVLTLFLGIILLLILFYAGYGLWDTWRIFDSASIDESLLKYKPSLEVSDDGVGFEELIAINEDVIAWLTVDGTNIDYPVVQGEDNNEYINTDVYRVFSLSGSIFLDYRNTSDFSDPYSLLYGHHMEGNVMFGELTYFNELEYFNEHTSSTLYTLNQVYEVEIFACLETDAYDLQVFYPDSISENSIEELIERLQIDASQYRDIGVTNSDKIIALSTCSDSSTNARTVVFGRVIDIED